MWLITLASDVARVATVPVDAMLCLRFPTTTGIASSESSRSGLGRYSD